MARLKDSNAGLYAGYAGAALVVVAAVAGLLQRGALSTPVAIALAAGVVLLIVSFFSSGLFTGRQLKYGTNSIVMVLLFGAVLALGNYLMSRYPQRVDMTKNKLFTLSDQTVQIVRGLDEPVHAVAFLTPGRSEDAGSLEELLRAYQRFSDGKFSFEIVDPEMDPIRARALKAQEYGTVVFLLGGKKQAAPDATPAAGPAGLQDLDVAAASAAPPEDQRRVSVTRNDYVEFDYSGAQMGRPPTSQFKGEQAFTSAILQLTGGEKKKVYFLAGHEELDPEGQDEAGLGQFNDALESEGYETAKLFLTQTRQVPQDATAVIVAGPRRPLLPFEAVLLNNYVRGGGKLFVLPNVFGSPSLNELTAPFHVEIGEDVVIDPRSYALLSPYTTVASQYKYHAITEKLTAYSLFPVARSLTQKQPATPWTVTELVQTTEAAWAEISPQARFRFDDGADKPGPVTLFAVVEGSATDVPAEVTPDAKPERYGFGDVEMPAPAPPAADEGMPADVPAGAAPVDEAAPPVDLPAEGQPPATEAAPQPGAEAAPPAETGAPPAGETGAAAVAPADAAGAPPAAAATDAAAAPGAGSAPARPEAQTPEDAPDGAQPPAAAPEVAPAATPPTGGQGGGPEAEAPAPAAEATAAPAGEGAPAAKTLRWSDDSRVAVLSTVAALDNEHFLQGANRDLVLNTMNWLAGKEELISIRAKDTSLPQMTLTDGQLDTIFWVTVVLVPMLIVSLAIVVWYRRR